MPKSTKPAKAKSPTKKTDGMRINRWLAQTSELSRRAADEAVLAGRITVNGELMREPGFIVNPGRDRVELDGQPLGGRGKLMYVAYHKPAKLMVTKSDPEGRKTIWDALPKWKSKLNSAGRLDYDSEGLLILTNDGEFIQELTHPKHELWKTYHVKIFTVPTERQLQKLQAGVRLEDGERTLPAEVTLLRNNERYAWLSLSIREGKNRQVRKMCEAVGLPVVRLKRVSIGSLQLGGLTEGMWRYLDPYEVSSLRAEAAGDA